MRASLVVIGVAASSVAFAQFQFSPVHNPFAPPKATMHYPPNRTCNLLDVNLHIRVDYPNRTIYGHVIDTFAALRNDVKIIDFNIGAGIDIHSLVVNGRAATYTTAPGWIYVHTQPLIRGQIAKVVINYAVGNAHGGGFPSGGGFHWIQPAKDQPDHVGFWTQGETSDNRQWLPMWDYPNDFASSTISCTVQRGWTVIANGSLVSDVVSKDKKSETWTWTLPTPHATYLISMVGGPLAVKKTMWEGIPLYFVAPKHLGGYLMQSFRDAKDELTFYSNKLHFKYPWPKYAQDCMYDFGGGMENVTNTTLDLSAIHSSLESDLGPDSLTSHEMAHQWFGDTVTCRDWGQIWLNESFAVFMQMCYFEHRFGEHAYQREVDRNMASAFNESRRYSRPIVTKLYMNSGNMFDAHTYAKGGVVLHTLRRLIGDQAFFGGLSAYLRAHEHTPVETAQLERSLEDYSGIEMGPFFDQWLFKPGHPVLDYSWTYDDAAHLLNLTVKQTQNTANGTPIYDIPAKVGLIVNGFLYRFPIHLSKVVDTFSISEAAKPQAVILDPDHDFLREIPDNHWDHTALRAVLQYAPNCDDRQFALTALMSPDPKTHPNGPSQSDVDLAIRMLKADAGPDPVFSSIMPLAALDRPSMSGLFIGMLHTGTIERRTQAVMALGMLPASKQATLALRGLIEPTTPVALVTAAIRTLSDWDASGNKDVFEKALKFKDPFNDIQGAAKAALGQ